MRKSAPTPPPTCCTPCRSATPATVRSTRRVLAQRAETALFADRGYREELGRWIGEGALGIPWVLSKLGQLAVTQLLLARRVAQAEAAWLRSAPALALLSTRDDRRAYQVRAGRSASSCCVRHRERAIQPKRLPSARGRTARRPPGLPEPPRIASRPAIGP